MRIDLSSLHEGRSIHLHEQVEAVDADLLGASLVEPLSVDYEGVSVDGVLYLRVTTRGKVYSRCDLCGVPTEAIASCTLDEELTPDGPFFDSETQSYDLADLTRQAIVLSSPRHSLCKPDCKGVCPVCGRNLNEGVCDCKPIPNIGDNNPFSVLQDLFSTGGANNGSTKM